MMLRFRDKGQNKKRSLTFCTGFKFSRLSDFDESRLKLIRSPHGFKKNVYFAIHKMLGNGSNKGSKVRPYTGLWVSDGCWPLNPCFPHFQTFKAWQTIYFLNPCGNPFNLSLFSLKSDHLENLTPVQKVNDLVLFCPLSR